ncbi:hypothetical protein ACVBGC_02395 [Burkholderia stagnalis]
MAFNTDMPSPESSVMSLDPACECPTVPPCDPVDTDKRIAAADASKPIRRVERPGGRSRRFRVDDAIGDAPPRPVTGSIALGFAVVSRRNWPR